MKLHVEPMTLREANQFVSKHHRHNGPTARNGGKFAIAAVLDELVGVGIVGNPISATFMDRKKYGFVAEVLRTCVLPDSPKGTVSFLYGACWRVWREMGGTRLLTYTLTDESGSSLRGAGWNRVAEIRPTENGWRKSDHLSNGELFDRRTHDPRSMGRSKYRWEVTKLPIETKST